MAKIIETNICKEFCALLLSKALILLEIPELKKVLELCGSSVTRKCCGSTTNTATLIQKEVYSLISSLEKTKLLKLREELLKEGQSNIKITFDKINKHITI